MAKEQQNGKKFNMSVAPMWLTKSGNLASILISDQVVETLKNVKPGGKLIVKFLPEERRRNQDSPNAYLEFMSKEDMEAFRRRRQEEESKAGSSENDDV